MRMRRATLASALAACLSVVPPAWGGTPAQAQRSDYDVDYVIAPLPPNLVRDEATTFLADFSGGELKILHSSGEESIRCEAPRLVPGGGLKAECSIPGRGLLDPRSWTVEMILRVPADQGGDTVFCRWEVSGNYAVIARITAGGGPSFHVRGPRGGAGRRHEFAFESNAGGNGFSLQANAPNRWVYLAFGFDVAGRRGNIIVRGMDGHLLANSIWFAGQGGLRGGFPEGITDAEKARLEEERWTEMARSLTEGGSPEIRLGHPGVEIARLRFSGRFRPEVVLPQPVPPSEGGRALTAEELDPARVRTRTVTRRVGLPGYRNFQERLLEEKYLPMAAGDPPILVKLHGLPVGLYSFFVYGRIADEGRPKLDRVWRPCPMEFEVKDASGRQVAFGRMLLKQAFWIRRMQGFHFHADTPGDYTASFRLAGRAMEKAEIVSLAFVDRLKGLPDRPVKTSQNLGAGANPKRLAALTDERKARDDAIWEALPPLNTHLQIHAQCREFREPPPGYRVGTWQTKAYLNVPARQREQHTFAPLTLINPATGEELSHEDVLAGKPWPGELADDGCGIYFPKENTYWCPRAVLLGERFLNFAHTITEHEAQVKLGRRYFETGDPDVGHDAAMALVRMAYDWPALEMNLHEIRLCTHSPDFEYNTDWSDPRIRNGKYFYRGWATDNFLELLRTYDQVFPYIQGNPVFAEAVRRHIPWVRTPDDVVRMLDRYLVFAGVRDTETPMLNAGRIHDMAALVLGPAPETAPWFDLTRCPAEIYPYKGRYQELYATALTRSGCYPIGSFMVYAFGDAAELILKADRIRRARDWGLRIPMDLSDVERFPKVKAAGRFLLDMWVAGGFPAPIGDASGGPHTGRVAERRLREVAEASRAAVRLWGDPRHAWILRHRDGDTDPGVARAAAACDRDPILHNRSRVVPDYMAVVELGPEETDPTRKGAVMLRLGCGRGHAHADFLDLNLFGMGLPLAVDLACRCEGNHWSRPPAGWGFLHNHAQAHDSEDPRSTTNQDGEPFLRSFEPPLMRASYVNGRGDERLDRDVAVMDIDDGDPATAYVFDLQRLRGGKIHTWCFHGCESEELRLNVETRPETVRWIDRTLKGTHRTGIASDILQAVWTMTREGKEYAHDFDKGGVVKTVACEKAVLGDRYDPGKPPVRVRATLLGRGGDTVLQGNPFSEPYAYCFPFLWVQNTAPRGENLYPAVYEWYRGDTPALRSVELVARDPLTVRVVTAGGQRDTFTEKDGALGIVSRDAAGAVRWARLSGGLELKEEGIALRAARAGYSTPITGIDYVRRRLETRDPLPTNPHAVIGSVNRRFLDLEGAGTSFTWADDLLIHEGEITGVKVLDSDRIEIRTNQQLFHGDSGNRKISGFTQVSEDFRWQFRDGKVIRRPEGVPLTDGIFTDANGDGLINLKTYEIGIGDPVEVLACVTVRRAAGSYEIQTNVPVEGHVGGMTFRVEPSPEWQKVTGAPALGPSRK